MHPEQVRTLVLGAFSAALPGDIDANTNFFDAGGDSVAAEQVLVSLSRDLSLDLPGWLLLDYPTVTTLSAAILR